MTSYICIGIVIALFAGILFFHYLAAPLMDDNGHIIKPTGIMFKNKDELIERLVKVLPDIKEFHSLDTTTSSHSIYFNVGEIRYKCHAELGTVEEVKGSILSSNANAYAIKKLLTYGKL